VIRKAHPQVLAVTGPHAADEVLQHVHAHLPQPHDPFTSLVPPQGIKLTPQHFAYLKISEGCNHSCTFCIIPSMRGPLVSRPIGDVLQEARHAGRRRCARIAGHFAGHQRLRCRCQVSNRLCRRSSAADPAARTLRSAGGLGIWVRLHYVYPYPSVDALLPLMAEGQAAAVSRRAFPARQPAHPEGDEASGECREQSRAPQGVAGGLSRDHGAQHLHHRLSR
jgi:ribosomal protein S12 methylthiotransferase